MPEAGKADNISLILGFYESYLSWIQDKAQSDGELLAKGATLRIY
jgi:hypothetical protein